MRHSHHQRSARSPAPTPTHSQRFASTFARHRAKHFVATRGPARTRKVKMGRQLRGLQLAGVAVLLALFVAARHHFASASEVGGRLREAVAARMQGASAGRDSWQACASDWNNCPAGPFQQTCSSCSISSTGTLTCTCANLGRSITSSLGNAWGCSGCIENSGAYLKCILPLGSCALRVCSMSGAPCACVSQKLSVTTPSPLRRIQQTNPCATRRVWAQTDGSRAWFPRNRTLWPTRVLVRTE